MTRFIKTLAHAAWLGWKVESNWADPFVFTIYQVVKPLSASLTIIVMYWAVTGGKTGSELFVFAYLGSAFQGFFHNVLTGTTMVVIEDREFYDTLAYIYISPSSFAVYLLGRTLTRFVLTLFSVSVVLLAGVVLVGLPIQWATVDLGLLTVAILLGVTCLTSLGILIAGGALLLTHRIWYLMEGLAGILFFFSGTIFPVSQLPPSLRWISSILPTTIWMDLTRQALVPSTAVFSPFRSSSTTELVLVMALMTLLSAGVGLATFSHCSRVARRWGYIQRKTLF